MADRKSRPFARVIFSATGMGLQKDAQLVKAVLEKAGCEVECIVLPFRPGLARVLYYWEKFKFKLPTLCSRAIDRLQLFLSSALRKRADLQIHLQNPSLAYLGAAKINWLIPNQEWARVERLHYLRFFDSILCKTRTAESIYQGHNSSVRWVGFSNRVCEKMPAYLKDLNRYRRFLHVGGNTLYKGTGAIVAAWRQNPQWPKLELVVSAPDKFVPLPDNVHVWQNIDEATLSQLRRECGVVLAPSEVEGFGHVLLEGMAWGAVVLTTDAPPMNELVTPARGFLVPWESQHQIRLGTRYCVSVEGVETSVEALLMQPVGELADLGASAREWVHENHLRFVSEFERMTRERL